MQRPQQIGCAHVDIGSVKQKGNLTRNRQRKTAVTGQPEGGKGTGARQRRMDCSATWWTYAELQGHFSKRIRCIEEAPQKKDATKMPTMPLLASILTNIFKNPALYNTGYSVQNVPCICPDHSHRLYSPWCSCVVLPPLSIQPRGRWTFWSAPQRNCNQPC